MQGALREAVDDGAAVQFHRGRLTGLMPDLTDRVVRPVEGACQRIGTLILASAKRERISTQSNKQAVGRWRSERSTAHAQAARIAQLAQPECQRLCGKLKIATGAIGDFARISDEASVRSSIRRIQFQALSLGLRHSSERPGMCFAFRRSIPQGSTEKVKQIDAVWGWRRHRLVTAECVLFQRG